MCSYSNVSPDPPGLLAFGSDSSKNLNYFETKTMYRILLRSLSTKEAGQTFAYCTLVTWSVLTEIGSVIFPVSVYRGRAVGGSGLDTLDLLARLRTAGVHHL